MKKGFSHKPHWVHGFSLIEMMVAIAVIFVGFSAIVAMALSAISNSGSSKAKLRATTFANGILEEYRARRDTDGISSLYTFPLPTPTTIDGVQYVPTATLYAIDGNSVLVEVNVTWTYKKLDHLMSYVLLTNYANRATIAAPYTTPSWFVQATSTVAPSPTSTSTPTNVPTFTSTPTPTPTQIPGVVFLNSALGTSCINYCEKYDYKSCLSVGTDSLATNSQMAVFADKAQACSLVSADCNTVVFADGSGQSCPGSLYGSKDEIVYPVNWTNCRCL